MVFSTYTVIWNEIASPPKYKSGVSQ